MFYVTDFHSGIIEDIEGWETLDEARAEKERLLQGEPDTGLWIIVDDDGNQYD